MRYLGNMRIGTRLIVSTSIMVGAAFATTMFVTVSGLLTHLRDHDKEIVLATADRAGSRVGDMLESELAQVRTLANIFESTTASGGIGLPRQTADTMLKHFIEWNTSVIAVYAAFEPNAFDDNDANHIIDSGHDQTGRYVPFWTRDPEGRGIVRPLTGYDTKDPADYYRLPKERKQECVLDPRIRQVQGRTVMVTSIVVPILSRDGTFQGIVGIDLPLDSIQALVKKGNLGSFKEGYGNVYSTDGTVAASAEETRLGKKVEETTSDRNFIEDVHMGKRTIKVRMSVLLGKQVLSTTIPLAIGSTGTQWLANVNIPLEELTAGDLRLILLLVAIAVGAVVAIVIAIRRIAGSIARPLGAGVEFAKQIAQGNLTATLDIGRRKDEFGELAEALNTEARKKEDELHRLMFVTEEKDRIEELVASRTAELAASELQTRTILETVAEAIIVCDRDGVIETFNSAATKTFGYTGSEAIGKPVDILVPKQFESDHASYIRRYRETGEAHAVGKLLELQGERKNGEVFPIEMFINEFTSEGEQRFVASIRDITMRKAAADKLRQLSRAVEQSPATIVITDREGHIEYVNPAFSRVTGYASQEALQNTPRVLKSGVHPKELYTKLWETITAGEEWHGEICNKKKNGELYWESVSISPIRNEEGQITHYVGVKDDITERRMFQEALRASEERFSLAMRGSKDGMWDWNFETGETYLSPQWKEMLGFQEEEIPNSPEGVMRFFLPADWEAIGDLFKNRVAEGACQFEAEQRNLHKDGHLVNILLRGKILRNAQSKLMRFVGTVQDITQRKREEEELKNAREAADAASRAKSEFLANMSHEIRTPLNVIIGFSSIALQSALNPKQREYLAKIRTAGESLLAVINDILDFSKIEAGKLETERVDFFLETVIETVVTLISPQAREKGLEFFLHVPPKISMTLVGDPFRLVQVLINFLGNAVKFTSRGEIELRVELFGQAVQRVGLRFSVRDTGIGLTEEQKGILFRPFVQADSSTTRKFGGTGLGLSISKRLVEMMGGTIQVESQLGKGSTFSFSEWFDTSEEGKDSRQSIPSQLVGLRVLVVDASETWRTDFQQMLESMTFTVQTATTGEAALEAVKANAAASTPYGLILIEYRLTGMNGLETARRIKGELALSTIPLVILVTSFAKDLEGMDTRNAGVEALLTKPLTASSILDVLTRNSQHSPAELSAETQWRACYKEILGGVRVLLAEDNEINAEIVCLMLQDVGIIVEVASNGREVVENVMNGSLPYDIVLMDIQMPELDGYEATRRIRSEKRFASLPIIALTAHAMTTDIDRALAEGMNGHISKPIVPATMFEIIARHLHRQGAEQVLLPPVSDPAHAVAFPAVEGIDVEDGVRRVGGDVRRYAELLRKFRASHDGTGERIAEALRSNERTLAERIAHSIKGVAGSLGAKELQRVAGELEESIGKGQMEEHAREILARFNSVLRGVMDALREAVGRETEYAEDARGKNATMGAAAKEILNKLCWYLERWDTEALQYAEEAWTALAEVMPEEELAMLRNSLETYDFKAALVRARTAAGLLNTGVQGAYADN